MHGVQNITLQYKGVGISDKSVVKLTKSRGGFEKPGASYIYAVLLTRVGSYCATRAKRLWQISDAGFVVAA